MTREFRLTSTSWAPVIRDNLYVLDYKGIRRFEPYRSPGQEPTLGMVLTHDNEYMEHLHELEVNCCMEDEDGQDAWIVNVGWHTHRDGRCPHGTELERETYEHAYKKMLTDEDQRRRYFEERVDWQWLQDTVTAWTEESLTCIAEFLKEHPVEAVYQRRNEEWIDIGDVLAFCPDCGEPIAGLWDDYDVPVEHTWQQQKGLYSPGPSKLCEGSESLGEYMGCLYDPQGNLRPLFCCPDCGFQFTTDDLDGTFVEHYGRPATWPRDAPYPPRRGFLGEAMDVVPWED